jgi:hypothetical protein
LEWRWWWSSHVKSSMSTVRSSWENFESKYPYKNLFLHHKIPCLKPNLTCLM